MLAAFETATVLKLDGEEELPRLGITLTTVRPEMTSAELRGGTSQLWRAIRERCPGARYCGFVEWTTGQQAQDGKRRQHRHYLVKDADRLAEDPEAEEWVSDLWRRYSGGAWRVEARPLRTAAGTIAYLSLHHRKLAQGPPVGWSGKRLLTGRGYFHRPVGELRQQARELLLNRRLRWAAAMALNMGTGDWTEDELDDILSRAVVEALAERAAHPPQLVRVREREQINPETGEVTGLLVEVIGPVEPQADHGDTATRSAGSCHAEARDLS